jgi:O-antigen chain-terminating methyltransferase
MFLFNVELFHVTSSVEENMDKPTIMATDIKDRIIEAMKAKRMEIQAKSNSSVSARNKGIDEISNKLNQLDIEVRDNNLKWNIVTEWAVTSDDSFKGKILKFIKKAARKLLRWYINPPLSQQREFNGSVTRSINVLKDLIYKISNEIHEIEVNTGDLSCEVESNGSKILEVRDTLKGRVENNRIEIEELKNILDKEIQNSDRKLDELRDVLESRVETNDSKIADLMNAYNAMAGKQHSILASIEHLDDKLSSQLKSELSFIADRLRRIERTVNKDLGLDIKTPTIDNMVIEDKRQNPDLDYFLFEQRFRGSREEIKERQSIYLSYFIGKSSVLDVGCGRGEFVELLLENGIGVTGIDINEDMVNYCQEMGLPVIQSDLFDHLISLNDNSLDGIFAAQVIEHLTSESLLKFIHIAYSKLKIGSVIVLETINPQNILAVNNWFYMDLTHVRPVHPDTLQFIMEAEGFKKACFVYLNTCSQDVIPNLYIEGTNNNLQEFNQAIARLNQILYGPQDYAIVCVK